MTSVPIPDAADVAARLDPGDLLAHLAESVHGIHACEAGTDDKHVDATGLRPMTGSLVRLRHSEFPSFRDHRRPPRHGVACGLETVAAEGLRRNRARSIPLRPAKAALFQRPMMLSLHFLRAADLHRRGMQDHFPGTTSQRRRGREGKFHLCELRSSAGPEPTDAWNGPMPGPRPYRKIFGASERGCG